MTSSILIKAIESFPLPPPFALPFILLPFDRYVVMASNLVLRPCRVSQWRGMALSSPSFPFPSFSFVTPDQLSCQNCAMRG